MVFRGHYCKSRSKQEKMISSLIVNPIFVSFKIIALPEHRWNRFFTNISQTWSCESLLMNVSDLKNRQEINDYLEFLSSLNEKPEFFPNENQETVQKNINNVQQFYQMADLTVYIIDQVLPLETTPQLSAPSTYLNAKAPQVIKCLNELFFHESAVNSEHVVQAREIIFNGGLISDCYSQNEKIVIEFLSKLYQSLLLVDEYAFFKETFSFQYVELSDISGNESLSSNTTNETTSENQAENYSETNQTIYFFRVLNYINIINNWITNKVTHDEFETFYKELEKKSKDDLELLLPFITLYEVVNKEQYKALNNFLMPIWKFNQLTAKSIFGDNGKELIKNYILLILDTQIEIDLNSNEVMGILGEMVEPLKGTVYFKDLREAKHEDSEVEKEILNKLKANVLAMRQTFYKNVGDANKESVKNTATQMITGEPNDLNACDTYERLFLEFFLGCINEKDDNPNDEGNLDNRVNSGGCKLMVQGVSDCLNIGDYNQLIEKVPIDSGPGSQQSDADIRGEWRSNLERLLHLQAKANILFNDPISLAKEHRNGELSDTDISTYYGENKPLEWFEKKLEEYHKIIDEFLKVYENLIHDINRNAAIKDNVKNEEFIKLIRYIHLIVAALTGVPLWSCKFTQRYFIAKTKSTVKNIKDQIARIAKRNNFEKYIENLNRYYQRALNWDQVRSNQLNTSNDNLTRLNELKKIISDLNEPFNTLDNS